MQTQLTSDDLLELRAQALRLANKLYEKLIDGSFPTFESRVRARNVWIRLCARADRRALAFHKVFTQHSGNTFASPHVDASVSSECRNEQFEQISKFHLESCALTSLSELHLEASALTSRLSAIFHRLSAVRFDSKEDSARFDRFFRIQMKAYDRAHRRFIAYDAAIEEFLTQQIASAVEREAFPPAPVFVHESEYSFNDEYNQVIDYDDELENSGDTFAAPPAGAPVLSATTLGAFEHVNVKSLQKGQGSTFEQRAEQGSGSSSCQADNPFVGRFCECDQCAEDRSKYSDTAGFLFQSVFVA